ncbi:hybrid PKS-NRPS [Sphaerosporella brunnea]|uniref:Hybrid PKS-NRPS n=1 Tax=Sphaerosporella brunnea TaxID=1250544 RepID=A0A5J5EHR9_9PEZI|nr:hybrid PKS-NRPS [Sphaerosporella brunnea]WMZ00176.1 PKS-NRPS [Sphaerosporella brunnea]
MEMKMTKLPLTKEPIALVGSSIRFPGANSPSKLWELLRQPHDVLEEEFPLNRMNLKSYYHPNGEHHGSTNVQQSYVISQDHRVFDAAFFNITPLEAEAMDPQQRILLEVIYEAMESAGFKIEAMQGSQTSVFVGLMTTDYSIIQFRDADTMPKYAATGTASSILSNRISYFFDWKGLSMTIDTACSSSLVAVHQAVQSLRNGESQVAVAAGANLILAPEPYIAESNLHMLSPGSRSRMWDINADGYARGDGFAAVMLKTLSQALKDGDHIECIIRETGVNSDGRTPGITMPNASAQTALIRETYRQAGLDCCLKTERCQYFEAHGTGTPAGDPIEAEAVRNAFFPEEDGHFSGESEEGPNENLYVGSIKTVVGHLEGCAGLAGLLKVSLALQKGVIPPNMHFNTLNPAISPFYTNLQIPIVPQPWPNVPAGSPRRASVNSFGFGGTNAHAIVESYDPEHHLPDHARVPDATRVGEGAQGRFIGPLTFSANSESSLAATIEAFSRHLKANNSIDLADLSWTLQSRRTVFPARAAFSGATSARLLASMEEHVQRFKQTPPSSGTRSRRIDSENAPRILGIFTGQGAQWPQMGRELLLASRVVEERVDFLERSLAELPDPPSWSLKAELMADASSSRIHQAAIAQPLCTAVQIALVDVLRCAGVSFDAIVGHSSGEIAATYAAGFLSASDAIRIAYYRGLHATSARGAAGAMMAAGMSFNDALDLCQSTQFAGRLCVAASNAPTSVTLSGDADAIQEAKDIIGAKDFARLLKVDTAYHSHHMHPAVEPYVRSLRACNIQVQPGNSSCVWTSSVTADRIADLESLADVYWTNNMIQPVLFSQAIERAMENGGPFDMMVEVGPHPALEGPVTQTVKPILGSTVPYCGLLRRGHDDVETLTGALGYIWTCFGRSAAIDFDGYRLVFENSPGQPRPPRLLKDLPAYSWDHDHIHWKESRVSRNSRFRDDQVHELLGRRRPDDSSHEIRWRNIIRLEEVPWLRGHLFQGQVVFPGAGYVAMALEASKSLWRGRSVMFVELQDILISRAMVIGEGSAGVETAFTLKCLDDKAETLTAEFTCSSCADEASGSLEKNCSGRVRVVLGEPSTDTLPPRCPVSRSMTHVDIDRFYRSLSELGLEYSGLFRRLESVQRTTHMATSSASWSGSVDMDWSLMVHPAMLDVAFQSMFASVGSVASVWTPYLPTSIRRIRVNTVSSRARPSAEMNLTIDAYATDISPATRHSPATLCGDVDIFSGDGDHLDIQVEGLSLKSISEANPSKDRHLFLQTIWDVDLASGFADFDPNAKDSEEEFELRELLERLTYLYLRELAAKTPREDIASFEWHHQRLFEYIDVQLSTIAREQHPIIRKEWASDTRELLFKMLEKFPGSVDVEAANTVAENLPAVLRGEKMMLEVLTKDDLLSRIYNEALGLSRGYGYIRRMARQVAHRYPQMRVLEIGAGTGATTECVLDSIDGAFSSYVFTDISPGFFEKARERFQKYATKMTFKVLNIENDVGDQDFEAHSVDLVIASNVVHATRRLKDTMENVRRLLKPGGYVLLLEPTGECLRVPFVMCGLPGWWLGGDDDRRLFPGIAPVQWDTLLRETGFSGVDTLLHDTIDSSQHMYSAIASQALDERFTLIRQPLLSPELVPQIEQLLIVGGKTLQVSRLIHTIRGLLPFLKHCTVRMDDLESLDAAAGQLSSATTVLCLTELDKPAFESLTPEKFRGMKQLFNNAKRVLWVTQGCRTGNPYSNMTIGVARVVLNEMSLLSEFDLQLLDLGHKSDIDARILTEVLLRLVMKDLLDHDVLWSTEPELVLEAGKLLIPRILPDKELNDRLNSSQRSILKEVSAVTSVVDVFWAGGSPCLREGKPVDALQLVDAPAGHVAVRVSYSFLCPLKVVAETYLYLCLGTIVGTGQRVIALSRSNSSTIVTLADWTCLCEVSGDEEERHLQSVAANLIAQNLLSSTAADAVLLLHQPQGFLADIVAQRAHSIGVKVICTTSQASLAGGNLWTYVHPFAPERELKKLLPKNVLKFIDWSENQSEDNVGARIRASLPFSCSIQRAKEFSGDEAKVDTNVSASTLRQSLTTAISHSTTGNTKGGEIEAANKVSAGDLSDSNARKHSICIIDWTQASTYQVNLQPLNPRDLLSHDKTYLLVGLTGDLGRSLCRWMIVNGGCNLVLTSRHPSVDSRWLEEMRGMGANIRVISMDVTDKQALASVHSEICRTMPPIAGVVNGAMVLSDAIFADMSFEALTSVLGPKADGSRNLDALFADKPLDFFIMLSSISSVAGYTGQSNYAAANMFMVGLAAQRRQRGLAASVIDMGMLTEIGYVARADKSLEEHLLRKNPCLPIFEPEFHQMFAEAIFAGRPESGHQPEIITGMQSEGRSIDDDNESPWTSNPRFSHFFREATDLEQQGQGGTATGHIAVREQLAAAATEEQAVDILQGAFSARLAVILQLAPDSINGMAPLIDLGVDSLIALEIRSWFLKEVEIDMSVLKVLSGDTIFGICKDAIAQLFASGLGVSDPNLDRANDNNCESEALSPSVPDDSIMGGSSRVARSSSPSAAEEYPNKTQSKGTDESMGIFCDEESGEDAMSWEDVKFGVESPQAAVPIYDNIPPAQSSIASGVPTTPDATTPPVLCTPALGPGGLHSRSHEVKLNFERLEHMSYAQSRLWFLKSYSEDPTSYNVVLSYDIKGPLHISRFKQAFQTAVRRHKSFRTCFFTQIETGEGMQGILPESSVVLEHRQISDDGEVQEEFDRTRNHVFDLEKGKTFRATLLTQSSTWSTVIFGYHHILMDGSSFFMFLGDLDKAYRMQPLTPLHNQYADFAANQRLLVERGELADDLAFWKDEFPDLPPPLPLFRFSRVRSRFASSAYGTHTVHAEIPQSHATKIRQASHQLRITPFHFHLAAIQALLFCFLDVDDLCIGITDANRMDGRFLETVGIFLNLLPLRFRRPQTGQTFAATAKDTSRRVYSALAHSRLPFDVLLEELNVPRSLAHTPLFQVLVNYRMGALEQIPLGDCEFRHRAINDARYPYDMLVTITTPSKDSCVLSLTLRDDLYTSDACGLLMKSYIHLLEQICHDPLGGVDTYSRLNDAEARLGIDVGRGPRVHYSYRETLSGRVDATVQSNPDEIAVKDGYGNTVTYAQLAQRRNAIAAALSDAGVAVGSYVAVVCEPSSDSIASLLAILHLGAIYVPLDLRTPTTRLAAIVNDCQPSAIICQTATLDTVHLLGPQRACVVDVSSLAESQGVAKSEDSSQADLPAFALYTSGSTGTPKGILLTQANLLNSINGTLDDQPSLGRETVLQQSSVGFDLSLYQTYRALANGGTLIVVPQHIRGDAIELSKLMLAENVTFTFATPSEYSVLLCYGSRYLKQCSAWRFACSGGENITSRLEQEFRRLAMPNLRLLNWFGPTEVGVFSTADVPYGDRESSAVEEYPSIGRPLPNLSVYILDERLQPVPTGHPGEICVGGAGVGLRYIDDDVLTRDKFIPDPFASSEDIERGWTRLYRSGDRGRLLNDGSVIFLGRMDGDSQIKLRGFRIELDDVANTILHTAKDSLTDAAVSVRGDPQFLVAFVVLSTENPPSDPASFLKKLSSDLPLPQYMCPAMMIPVHQLPSTINGKRDRAALDAIPLVALPNDLPKQDRLSSTESQLKSLWMDTLSHIIDEPDIGIDDGFFQAGGSSILLMKLQALIRETFGIEAPLVELFQANTLRTMASMIAAKRKQGTNGIVHDLRDLSSPAIEANEAEKTTATTTNVSLDKAPNAVNDVIDWDAETAVSEAEIPKPIERPAPAPEGQRASSVILLTGSTGLLARTILRKLVEDSSVAKVHIVTVRSDADDDEFTALASDSAGAAKVETHTGDLAMPDLGLSAANADRLFKEADAIIHGAGAELGWFLGSYQELRQKTLGATKDLIRLALPRRIPVHFVSSDRVVLFTGRTSLSEVSVAGSYPPAAGQSEGLTAAKWACERYLERIAEKSGLPIWIHRSCSVFGDGAAPTDVVNALVRYASLLRATPNLDNVGGFVDYAPADRIAGEIVVGVVGNTLVQLSGRRSSAAFVHYASGRRVTPQELKRHLEEQEGCSFEQLTVDEWICRAKRLGISGFVTSYLEALRNKGEAASFPLLLRSEGI